MTQQEIYELKNSRKQALDAAETALKAKDMDTYKAKIADVDKYNAEIEAGDRLMAEEGKFDDANKGMVSLADSVAREKADAIKGSAIDAARSGNDYIKAFATAIRQQVTVKRGRDREELSPLYKALTVTGGDPVGSDGGFLVPIEFDNMINRITRDYIDLSALFNVEAVNAISGWRAVETANLRKKLPLIAEMGTIGKDEQPKFKKVTYSIQKYGDRLPISSELMNDNTAGLLQYLAEWFGPKYVMTKNNILLTLLNSITAAALTPGSESKELKSALTKDLRTAISRGATLLTNQSGYSEMENWEDKNGRPLLVPNPADVDTYRFKGRSVVYGDDDQIANISTAAPIYIGNFKAFGTLFERKAIEVAATDVGGDAWATDSYELRAICRLDAQKVDDTAAILRTVTLPV